MPPKKSAGGLSVAAILNEAQRASASGHLRYAKLLWECAEEDTTGTAEQLQFALKLFLTVAEKTMYQDRLLRFMAAFAGEVKDQGRLDFMEALLGALVELSYAKEPTARWRACQLLHCMIGSLPGDAALADDVADTVQEAMLDRLDDAKPNVRAAAVRALARLPIPDDDGDFTECAVTTALMELLAAEKSKEVRKAVLASLPAAPCTSAALLERTRDDADEVRRVTYLALAEKLSLSTLGADQGALLLRRGLKDRSPPVAEAAAAMVSAWLEGGCGGDPLVLLRRLEVERHAEEGEMAIKALVAAGRLDAVAVGRLASEDGVGLRQRFDGADAAALLSAEEALFWRVICEWLAAEAASKGLAAASTAGATANIEAAAAGDRLEALEAALPASVEEMVGVIQAHACAGPAAQFAATQLLGLAARCMDFSDASGRRAAAVLLEEVLLQGGVAGEEATVSAWREATGLLLRKVHAAPAELADAVLAVLGRLHASGDFADETGQEGAWLHALRTASLLLDNLPSARPAVAAVAGFSLLDLLHGLVQPGVRHDSPAVRQEALRCLGLYCLLEGIPTSIASHVTVLRAYLISPSQPAAVRAVAAQALGDLALQRGAKALDTLNVALPDGEEAAEDPLLATEPTIDLLRDVLHSWLERFATACAPTGRGRAARAIDPAVVQDEAKLGTAVVEALVRLVAVNEFRQAADSRRGEATALEDTEVVALLVALLRLQFDPASEQAARLRQCLAVFFERFAGLSVTSQQYLATALLPAARVAAAEDVAAGRRTAAASPLAPQVVRFALQLLQVPVLAPGGRREPLGHEPLAELVVGEVVACAGRTDVPKPYLAALCKLPLALPMFDAGEDTREIVRNIEVCAAAAAKVLPDRLMKKDMQAVRERYGAAPQGDQPELSEQEIAALLCGVKTHVETFCCELGYPSPFGAEGEAAEPQARGGRRAAAAAPDSDADSDDEPVPAAAAGPRRRMPARSTRTTKVLAEDSDDNDARAPPRPPQRAAAVAPAASGSEDDSEDDSGSSEDSSSDEDGEGEGQEGGENEPRSASAKAMRRASTASVAALREALRENARIC